jgi:hypothetical protein
MNPLGQIVSFIVSIDGSGRLERPPGATIIPGGTVDPSFQITGDRPQAGIIQLPGEPSGPPASSLLGVREIFLRDGDNLLQLTNFGRADTFTNSPLSRGAQQVIFVASADPLGTNPTNNCQIFSIDRTGSDLRQLTAFQEGAASRNGCTTFFAKPQGCYVEITSQDAVTQSLVFGSTCDPFGTNPNGAQLFAVRPDGTGLRQLTDFAGFERQADRRVTAEGPAAFAFASAPL